MILCSITSPLFDLHKLIRLIVEPLHFSLSLSSSNIHRIKEEEEYFILLSSSFPCFHHPNEKSNDMKVDELAFPARSLSSNLPTFLQRSTNQRSIKKERKKCRFTNCETRFPLARGWLRSRYQRGTHDKKRALDWRKSRWFLDPVKPHPSLPIKAHHSRWVSARTGWWIRQLVSARLLQDRSRVRVIMRFIRGDDFPRKPR